MLSLLKRFLQFVKDLFRSRDEKLEEIGQVFNKIQPPADDGPVQPWTLCTLVLDACTNGGMAYTESMRQLPCTYTVYVSEPDFNLFYRRNKEEVEGEIVSALNDYVRETGDRMKPPAVTICIDAELYSGESYVEASFDTVEIEKTQQPFINPEATRKSKSDPNRTLPIAAGNASDKQAPEPPSVTPVLKTIRPQLVAADGSIHNLSDGATVGILRDNRRSLPSISLQPSRDLHFCSQKHGEFRVTRDGEYSYRNLSNNGSTVVRAGVSHALGPNSEPFVLHSGDSIILGTGNPAITFVLSEH